MLFFFRCIKRFNRDESGAFAVIFGVMAIVLIATGGSVVDFVTIQQNRSNAQISLDAAVLALQPKIHTQTKAQIKATAEKLLIEGINNAGVTLKMLEPEIDKEEGRLMLQARISNPTFFVRLIGIDEMEALITSEATRAKNKLEVVMVLDNSGSMGGTPISNLISAAKKAVDIVSDYEATPDKVFFGLAPFNYFINVGTANKDKAWMDKLGQSSISWDNFDDDDDSSNSHDPTDPSDRLSRFDLYDLMHSSVKWNGCVEARPHNLTTKFEDRLDVSDVEPNSTVGDTLFVPMFRPDTPSGYRDSYISDDPPSCASMRPIVNVGECTVESWTGGWRYSKGSTSDFNPKSGESSRGSCSCAGLTITSSHTHYNAQYGTFTREKCDIMDRTNNYSIGTREKQERICKYIGVNNSGPNSQCTIQAITPLTNNMGSVKGKIGAMEAGGGTNIHMGAMWGWRVLSPTAPFEEGSDYDSGTSKVMILMTDGANTPYPAGSLGGSYDKSLNNTDYYSMYGMHNNGRLGDVSSNASELTAEMDKRTLQVCANAKDKGIDMYVIGLGVTSSSTNGKMLAKCASSSAHVFFPASSSELDGVFTAIADQLKDLRLSK